MFIPATRAFSTSQRIRHISQLGQSVRATEKGQLRFASSHYAVLSGPAPANNLLICVVKWIAREGVAHLVHYQDGDPSMGKPAKSPILAFKSKPRKPLLHDRPPEDEAVTGSAGGFLFAAIHWGGSESLQARDVGQGRVGDQPGQPRRTNRSRGLVHNNNAKASMAFSPNDQADFRNGVTRRLIFGLESRSLIRSSSGIHLRPRRALTPHPITLRRNCRRPAVRTLGDCVLCNRHLCSSHLQPDFHRCPHCKDADAYGPVAREAEERELMKLFGKIDKRSTANDAAVPTSLEPWPHFLDQQRSIFDMIYECFPTEARPGLLRPEVSWLVWERVSQRSIANEKTLKYFMHNSVEDPVRVIVEQFKQVEEFHDAFDIGSGIVFENRPHAISDVAEEVAARENASTPHTGH
ncbi:hypothetical protein ACRALDRAFT_213038 [Sodiomyces alcalophilus JCM 7366]|uniref:uncharacterized protein n=1 Tax=Sodiomyces alcalophilus JCM 7366 TaxID=591952 RepID=UPI0039B66CCD